MASRTQQATLLTLLSRRAELAILQHPLDGGAVQFSGVAGAQFALNVFPMGVDGVGAKMKLAGDRSGGEAFADEPENLEFAIGEACDGTFARVALNCAGDKALHRI